MDEKIPEDLKKELKDTEDSLSETEREKHEDLEEEIQKEGTEGEEGSEGKDIKGEAQTEEAQAEETQVEETQVEETQAEEAQIEDPLADLLEDAKVIKDENEEKEGSAKSEEELEKGSKFSLVFFIIGMSIISALIGGGGFLIWYLWQVPGINLQFKSTNFQNQKNSTSEEEPFVTPPIGVENRKLLVLENFLIPYQRETGEYVFVKAKVLLYFENDRDYFIAKKNKTLWREYIYRVLKNVPLYVWEDKRGEKVVHKELWSYLKKKEIDGITPVDLEVTGYILK